jgi:WD40 repeat protein
VNAVAFSPNSKHLVTGSADGTAIVWDVAAGRSVLTLTGSTAAISSVLYSSNGKFILTGCSDGYGLRRRRRWTEVRIDQDSRQENHEGPKHIPALALANVVQRDRKSAWLL